MPVAGEVAGCAGPLLKSRLGIAKESTGIGHSYRTQGACATRPGLHRKPLPALYLYLVGESILYAP
jgi:hypothetical protein